jgi:cell division protease FtsH
MPDQDDHNRSDRQDSGRGGKDNKGQQNPGSGPPQGGPQNFMSRSIFGWVLLAGLAVLVLILLTSASSRPKNVSPNEFIIMAGNGQFKSVTLYDEQMIGELKDNAPGVEQHVGVQRYAAVISRDTKPDWAMRLYKVFPGFDENPGSSVWVRLLVNWSPLILVAFLVWFFVYRSLRSAGGGPGMLGNFARSKHKVSNKEHSNVTLADVAGIEEAKEEVEEIIEFLKNPKKFQRLGGRVPRGVLLIGDPGCGKTLLAKAVAGEADVPFFSISGSDFVEMFVGVGASRVRDLFKQAKESSPCIIFLDEIDAVGRKRGSGFSSGGHDEREQTLNAILVEMDGFETNDQVIVMAATNRSDVLDPALIRPGRFDRQIHVPLPDIRGRVEILKVHSRRVKMSPMVDIEKLARGTPMFSGADLAAIINEAAISATLLGKDFVEQDDLEEARDKVKWGRARRSHKIDEMEKKVIAYHEAGHALVMFFDQDSEPLHKVTIIPRGQALGVTFMLPERDKYIHTRKQLVAKLRVTFGGRIAEEMFCGDISSGAAQDIRQATAIARAMVMHYGMSDKLGFQLFGLDESKNPWEQPEKHFSDETAKLIDEEVKKLIDQSYNETRQLLEEHRDQLHELAEALLRYETLNRDEVERLMRGEKLNKTTVSDLIKAEQDKRPGKTIAPESTALGNDTKEGSGPTLSPA